MPWVPGEDFISTLTVKNDTGALARRRFVDQKLTSDRHASRRLLLCLGNPIDISLQPPGREHGPEALELQRGHHLINISQPTVAARIRRQNHRYRHATFATLPVTWRRHGRQQRGIEAT